MKAPISEKIRTILSDRTNSKKLAQAVVEKTDEPTIEIGDKKYELHRVASHSRDF